MKTIIAIDPGKKGGIAVRNAGLTGCWPMPATQGDFVDQLRGHACSDCVCYLELVGGFLKGRRQPGATMFKFGESFGFIKGVVQTLGIRLVLVRPQDWQKRFHLGTRSACVSDSEWKNKLKAEAQRRFPHLDVTLMTSDALLILDYAIVAETEGMGR